MKRLANARPVRVPAPSALMALALACAGCAFNAGGGDASVEHCASDADCSSHKACSPMSMMCELQAPEPEDLKLAGPFEVIPAEPLWGGAALAASWEKFTSNTFTIPAMTVVLAHQSGGSDVDGGNPNFGMVFRGARHYDATFGGLVFFHAFIEVPKSSIAAGTQSVTPAAGALNLCPANAVPEDGSVDKDNPWQSDSNAAILSCWQLFEIHKGTITFETADIGTGGMVSGYMDLTIAPNVFAPEQ